MAQIHEVCLVTLYTWYSVTSLTTLCWAKQTELSTCWSPHCSEWDNPYLEVVQRLHLHDWSQSVEGQGDVNTLVWHQRCVNGQWGARDDPKARQEKNRGDESSTALPNTYSPFAKHKLAHLPITPELPLLLLQGRNTAQNSRHWK